MYYVYQTLDGVRVDAVIVNETYRSGDYIDKLYAFPAYIFVPNCNGIGDAWGSYVQAYATWQACEAYEVPKIVLMAHMLNQ